MDTGHLIWRFFLSFLGENILLVSCNGGNYRPMISDFGLSLDTTSHDYSIARGRGTIRYRSPEVLILIANCVSIRILINSNA